ncbi:ParB/RepB/Spo0J family partition protein [Carboxydochorda subterranea]|uniref:ParB/RepB/Spo0J family partition protein n=1 Tax=Carboxydichorda subterranea TaxID=3109565 RepID=A0ABZ1C2D1_9FIRM|nr:ParB/RepB/Spo0J family partition protein [Limnochorda sp. L945t]WRP18980.1 ParB/RepB/Spo0J family partition protein [Limnochorda sp. L945t]
MRLGELLRGRTAGGPRVARQAGIDEAPAVDVRWIEVQRIHPSPYQARQGISQEELEGLAQSIREHGLIQPIVVRPVEQGYELIAGERRWRAAQLAGLERVPAIVRESDDRTAAEWGLIENLQRSGLHFLEEADGYRRIMERFGLTQEEMARVLGCSQAAVANKIRLLKLAPEVQAFIREQKLGERQSRALLRVQDPEQQLKLARRMAEEGLGAEASERLVEQAVQGKPKRRTVRGAYGDARIFVNGLRQVVRQARQAGIEASLSEEEDGDGWTFVVKLGRRVLERGERGKGDRRWGAS